MSFSVSLPNYSGMSSPAAKTVSNSQDLPAKYWYNAYYQEGGEQGMWIPWEQLSSSDQQKINDYYVKNKLDPLKNAHYATAQERGYAADDVEAENRLKAFNPNYTAYTQGGGDSAVTTYRQSSDKDYANILRKGGGKKNTHGTWLPKDTASMYANGEYDKTQAGLLYDIDPAMAAKYGIDEQKARYFDIRNWYLQSGRRYTTDKHDAAEAAAALSIVGAMATFGVGAGFGAALGAGTSTAGTVAAGAATGATMGGVTATMTEQDVGKGIAYGAVGGAIGGYASTLGGTTAGVSNSTIASSAGNAAVNYAKTGDSKSALIGAAGSAIGSYVGNETGSPTIGKLAGGFSVSLMNKTWGADSSSQTKQSSGTTGTTGTTDNTTTGTTGSYLPTFTPKFTRG